MEQKLELEVYYVENQSVGYDIKLIFKTAYLILLTVLGKDDFELPKELEYIQEAKKKKSATEEIPV